MFASILDQVAPFAFFSPGPLEMAIIGVIAVLLFGRKLPEVARSAGRSLIEFKRGMQGIEDDVRSSSNTSKSYDTYDDDRDEPTAPKFEPPASEPKAEATQ